MQTAVRGVGSIIENNRSLWLSSPESGGDRLVNRKLQYRSACADMHKDRADMFIVN